MLLGDLALEEFYSLAIYLVALPVVLLYQPVVIFCCLLVTPSKKMMPKISLVVEAAESPFCCAHLSKLFQTD